MPASKDERDRILGMIESRQITANQAARLLDALESELEPAVESRGRDRKVRVHVSYLRSRPKQGPQSLNMDVVLPIHIIRISLRLGAKLIPQLSNNAYEDLLRAIESGATGRLLDVQDLEKGERLEVFVE